MIRAHLIRLNPTPQQAEYFRKACGTARFVFNWALARWKHYRAQGRRVSMLQLKKEFNHLKRERFPWVYDVTKCAAEQEFVYLGQALANFFRKKRLARCRNALGRARMASRVASHTSSRGSVAMARSISPMTSSQLMGIPSRSLSSGGST